MTRPMRGIWYNGVLENVLDESQIRSQIRTAKQPFIPVPDLSPIGLQMKQSSGTLNQIPGSRREED